jgi:glycosyltransferase involved in cell wall biosynthesis
MNRATGWIYSGQTVLENLKNRPGYRDKPARLIPLGVDTRVFCPNPEAKREILRELEWEKSQAPVIGYVGRFVPEKGLSLLMRVLGQLQTSWRALFVGAGRMESKLRSWAQSHGDRVRIVTDAGHAEMPAYYNAMDLLCAPSQTTTHWREQFGRMLIEAFACGVPVIGSDSGEIPYVVGDTGVIVDEKDEDLWVKNIEELLGDVGRRQYLARVGRERAEQKYAWPLVAKQHLDFFEELLNETHRLSR